MLARVRSAALGIVLVLASCGASAPPSPPAPLPARTVRYTFALEPDLEHMHTTVCFEDGVPDALAAIHEEGRARVETAEVLRADGPHALPIDGEISLRGVAPGECVRYRVDLAPGRRATPGAPGSYRVGDDLVAPTSLWLRAPSPRDASTAMLARFVLPDGVRASTVWPDADEEGWMRIDERAFRYIAYVAFGELEVERVPVPGGCIDAVVLDGALQIDAEQRRAWLGTAGRAVSRVLGRFPAERAGVIVVPTPFADTPVLFGIVGRGALPTIALLVGENARPDALVPDWTAVHEFTHLASPFVERDEAWITEGLATYYQQVLRAREGMLTPEQAWNEMLHGFARGRSEGTGRTLREESRDMLRTYAFGRVYWSGAALALMADVAYRRSSDGQGSLDDAMVRASDRRDETLRADELVRAMDGGDGGPFAQVIAPWIDRDEFPDVDETLAWLGVRRGVAGVELLDAPGAAIRDAIMNPGAPLASNPDGCR
ncbi:hypothetical protein DB32_007557 [Sandaracinus amylolyticus]|uniref:Peptidase M61 catalytic domain-containing protein n=1 Tax=Sandaracinus amylolyticus TaxID=927083 RepID=A0A0F6W8Y9_9BACT|nr:hypothetical protein DB32_007557 [Sandaracinus amylolyticus]